VSCGGVQVHVRDRESFEPVVTGITMVKVAYDLYRPEFRWKEPPYEYVYDRNPFDVIGGTSSIREGIERGASIKEIKSTWPGPFDEFLRAREEYLLY
jgi:uncharacterized protein YbbC (DUF1343 family)